MRKSVVTLIALVALAAFGFVSDGAWAATVKLKGKHSSGEIASTCVLVGGQYTGAGDPNKYGCKTTKGEVSCNRQTEMCTGTCQACRARLVRGSGKGTLTVVLTGSASARQRVIRVKG